MSESSVIQAGPFKGLRRNHFKVIVADPAWVFKTWSELGMGRSAEQHYHCMSLEDIMALPVHELAAPGCVLLLWVTDPLMNRAEEVIKAWQFKFKTVGFYWVKTTKTGKPFKGMGYWTRANPEQCLLCVAQEDFPGQAWLATSGSPKRMHKNIDRLIMSPRREHSRKPEELYDALELMLDGPYIELFSRQERPRWANWGNEVGKFNDPYHWPSYDDAMALV